MPTPSTFPFATYDAFASNKRFSGNPAAVCVDETNAMPDDLLQLVAREFNLSETAFVTPVSADDLPTYRLRWFTVEREVSLCGHATLAAAKCLFTTVPALASATQLRFLTKTGELYASKLEEDVYEVDFPADLPVPETDLQAKDHARAVFREAIPTLGTLNFDIYKHKRGYMAYVRLPTTTTLSSLTVHSEAFRKLEGLVHFLTCDQHAGTEGSDFFSRSFAPVIGIQEDSVTGTAHTALGAFYAAKRGPQSSDEPLLLQGFQASQRTGIVTCIIKGDRVILRGKVVSVLSGQLQIPPA